VSSSGKASILESIFTIFTEDIYSTRFPKACKQQYFVPNLNLAQDFLKAVKNNILCLIKLGAFLSLIKSFNNFLSPASICFYWFIVIWLFYNSSFFRWRKTIRTQVLCLHTPRLLSLSLSLKHQELLPLFPLLPP